MKNFDYKTVEDIIQYSFRDKNLLRSAFIHSSYANESKEKSNERLEFLGDSVLSISVTDYIFKNYKNNEGDLSKIRASLVSEKTLSFIFEGLGLDKFIITGVGLKNTKPSKAMMADAFEALVASIYIDGGLDKARKFILRVLDSAFSEISQLGVPDSNKSKLQEKFKSDRIHYETTFLGQGQNKVYTATVFINGIASGVGKSSKKREAEELSALEALKNIKKC